MKIFLSIIDGAVVVLGICSFEISLYFARKLYESNYIQNIHKATDLTKLNPFDIIIGIDGGIFTMVIGTLALWTMGLKLFIFIESKIKTKFLE